MPRSKLKTYHTKQTISLFWRHVRRYPGYLWPLLAIIPFNIMIADFAMPYITSVILGRLSTGHYDPVNLWGSFGPLLLLYAAGSLATGIIGWRVAIWLIWNLELNAARDITQRVFNHLMNQSAGFHSNRFGGSLVSQAGKLTGSYVRVADATAFSLIPLIVSIIATAVILTPRAPMFVAVLLLFSALYIGGTLIYSRAVRVANAEESTLQSTQTGYLADSITNVFAVKTFARATHEQRRYAEITERVRQAGRRSMRATLLRENYAAIITQTISVLALFVAVIGVGVLRADVATIFLMVSYTTSLSSRLWEFQNVLRQYNRALGDASDMVGILQIEPSIKDPARPEPSRLHAGEIVFRNMTFTHGESDDPLFENLNLHIAPGEKIGLVGRSGSGKTTLTRLLLRFSDLDSGSIIIDGQNITAVTQDNLRRAISYVPQEPLLFHRSLRENIAYGKPSATKAEIERASDRAHAAEFIHKLPQGYDTMVGERGVKLSGGQRQRVAIARAMLKDAPILVLDEATSALDSESEKLIQDALWRLMEGRTAIVIAHRLSTIQRMDRIVVLEAGRIIEQGSHAELIAAGGQYAALWSHQSGGFIDEETDADAAAAPPAH
ncbi:MAG TPA: ABC transporter ATP-binding protein [Candidatus Saccharimonadia bacterium]|nr:ABC transporter ATP-binding protein [Candidatus Saccharimonadia bacterium]